MEWIHKSSTARKKESKKQPPDKQRFSESIFARLFSKLKAKLLLEISGFSSVASNSNEFDPCGGITAFGPTLFET